MFHVDPKFGSFSIGRKFYNKEDEKISICQDFLKYISLDKFGNDNKNFAAILINGHNDNRICEQLQRNIISDLQSNNFSKSMISHDIQSYIESILSQFEIKFLKKMTNLSMKREAMFRRMSISEDEVKDPKLLHDLTDMEDQLNSGATVAIVAVIQGNIFISNIGDNQIVLVLKDNNCHDDYNQISVLLTDEQSFHNEKEIHRIKEDCGLDPDALRWLSILSTERCHSRCIGDFDIKCNYNKFQNLREAKSSPLISIPQQSKCIPLEENFTHFLLISSGLYYLVRELIYDKDKIPGEITRKLFEIKSRQPELSLDQLCKSVLESFIKEHRECYDQYQNLNTDDCTFLEYSHHDDLSLFIIDLLVSPSPTHVVLDAANGFSLVDSINSNMTNNFDSVDGTDYSNSIKEQFSSLKTLNTASMAAYVDFSGWHEAVSKLSDADLAFVDSIVNSSESCKGTITEEGENQAVSRSSTFEEKISVVTSPAPPASSSPSSSLLLFESVDK